MLCEKCNTREAQVKITKVINGVSEVHNLCQECASILGAQEENAVSEWSKAIFRLLSDVVRQGGSQKNTEEAQDELKGITCPTCNKTYGEFLEDRTLGCSDCYEAFGPSLGQAILRVQGAENHTGKTLKKGKKKRTKVENADNMKLSLDEEIRMLEEQMNQAVQIEDYEAAAVLRDKIKALKEQKNG